MARYILIDNFSGYIFGDSADIDGHIVTGTPEEVAKALDESIGERGRSYAFQHTDPCDTRTGYHIWRSDIDGSDQIDQINDGQSAEMIAAVTDTCRYVGFVSCFDMEA